MANRETQNATFPLSLQPSSLWLAGDGMQDAEKMRRETWTVCLFPLPFAPSAQQSGGGLSKTVLIEEACVFTIEIIEVKLRL